VTQSTPVRTGFINLAYVVVLPNPTQAKLWENPTHVHV
jgi:hypothetical protein